MIKLIVTDMDGTLLNSNHEINNEFWGTFEEIKKRGIVFSAASGRQYHNLLEKFDSIKDDMLFIAENGTYVVKNGEELFSNTMDKKEIKKLVEIGRKIDGAHLVLCGKKSAYLESSSEEFIAEVEKYYQRYEIVEDILEVEDEVLKVTLCDFKGSEENSHKYYKNYEEKFKITVSGKLWLDIVNKTANKGVAIEKVQQILGIDSSETMAFGDYLNDIEMIENAQYSYAMENAHPKLKEISRFIAKSNDENGVVEVIKEKVLR
jgi:Cof subfamily protein (haloacid dehalogenase superfamily)